jgi:hypothetical protein
VGALRAEAEGHDVSIKSVLTGRHDSDPKLSLREFAERSA